MSAGLIGAAAALTGDSVRSGLRDMMAGAIGSVLSIAYSLSYAALIFSGPLADRVSYGVAVSFLSAAIGAGVVAMRSSFPFAIAGGDSSISAVIAVLVAAMLSRVAPAGPDDLLGVSVIVMALGTAMTGVLLGVLGLSQAGRAIRFIPYPVIGGFLGATGLLMMIGAVQVTTSRSFSIADPMPPLGPLSAAIAVAVVLQVLVDRWRNPFVLPSVLLTAVLGTHAVLALAGEPLVQAQADGWMFNAGPASALASPWQLGELRRFPWGELPWLGGELLSVMFVTTVSLLLSITGVEIATKRDADIGRELKALALANIIAAALGGFVSCLSLSRTTLNYSAGARGRLSGLTVAAISGAMVVIDPSFLLYVPKFALGGFLLFAGAQLAYRWLVRSYHQLPAVEYLSLAAIALIIVKWGFIAGVLIGVAIGCLTFALSASRVSAIKFSFDGSEHRSSLDRSVDELAILARHGREIQGLSLQSYLFFGSANRLYEHVKALLKSRPETRFLVFDFKLVTGIDSSATHSFSQIRDAAGECGAQLVFVNLRAELQKAFRVAHFIDADVILSENLDRALEGCEEAVIKAHRIEGDQGGSFRAWLSDALHSPERADRLAAQCRRLEVRPGDIIAREGDPANAMHFIVEGRVAVIVALEDGRSVRVRSLGRQTMIGEMGLIATRPRSATIEAEQHSILYELPLETYERIIQQDPDLGQAMLSYVVAIMAERLSFANRMIGVLQR